MAKDDKKKLINQLKKELKEEVKKQEQEKVEPEYVREELTEVNKNTNVKTKEKKVRIIIDEQVGPDAHSEVFVGVNGKHFLIKRGHEVEVPQSVVNVLSEAVITKIIRHEDGTEELKRIPRISFRVLGIAQ